MLKPDGIGDFVLATGALRALAAEYGEQNLLLCVRSILVPLAQSQFPSATILDLPTAAKRRIVNLFARNLAACAPLWMKLRLTPVGASVCLRSMRNYLETLLFYSPRTRRFLAPENLLLAGGRKVRTTVENAARRLHRAELVPYPAPGGAIPREIEAHRRVLSELFGREVSAEEIMPRLQSRQSPAHSFWICAPVTSLASKDYPLPKWRDVFSLLREEAAGREIILAGAEADRGRLEELRKLLEEAGIGPVKVVLPASLVAYMDLIAGAELMMTVDTAAAHLATALDRPTLVVFSGLHLGMFGPWRRSARQAWLLPEDVPAGKKWHAGIAPMRAAMEVRRILKSPAVAPG